MPDVEVGTGFDPGVAHDVGRVAAGREDKGQQDRGGTHGQMMHAHPGGVKGTRG